MGSICRKNSVGTLREAITRRRLLTGSLLAAGGMLLPGRSWAVPSVHIVYAPDFIPLSYLDHDKVMRGFYVDLFDEILGKGLGLDVLHSGLPWKRAQLLVKKRQADALCTNSTPTRRGYLNFCKEEIIENRRVVVFKKGGDLDRDVASDLTLEEVKELKHISYLGNGWAEANLTGMNLEFATTSSNALKVLDDGKADVFITGELQARFRIRALGFHDQLAFRYLKTAEKAVHHFGLRKDFPGCQKIITAFDQRLISMKKDGHFARLLSSYIG
ncbi:transporter substrate-binding domain-containing protein [Kiloniella laminariae]|uniref:Transporter substrate-binding domain-containing protein n=1 Tax=Kiloniella laminariae TaxID=454162 RepID=A0ABT4LFH7_9PROT|nr:transporter substrate-binding domain-containing protein [Kiloniella laminariae]MCZ4279857.1 transporter substrate-binding domain-containing protein [Kiloniella laminariae]